MHYGDQIGAAKVLAKMKQFQSSMGEAFRPAAALEKLVAEGKTLADFKL